MDKNANILRHSNNPTELVVTARLFAVSTQPADQRVLAGYLGSTDFINRLDPPEAYEVFQPHQLNVARIIKTLMDQDSPQQRETLVSLTTSPAFQSYDLLIELLIRALAVDRPACPRTIAYWQRHLDPESVYADNVAAALFVNQSQPALELFERTLNDPEQDDEYKYDWLRDKMLPKRNDTPVLECCERMVIQGSVDEGWHEPIIEAVFDFNTAWYASCRYPSPPLRVLAPDRSKDCLERLGRHAVTRMKLFSPTLGLTVRAAMKEIGRNWEEEHENA